MLAHKQGDFNEEYRLVTPDGSVRWISARTLPHSGAAGKINAIGGLAQDITQQKKVEETLRSVLARTQERYILSRRIGAARTSNDVLHALRSVTTFSDANRAAILLFDQPWGDFPPSRCDVLVEWRDNADLPSLAGESYPFGQYEFAKLFLRDELLLLTMCRQTHIFPTAPGVC